jgi:hypothetical protein
MSASAGRGISRSVTVTISTRRGKNHHGPRRGATKSVWKAVDDDPGSRMLCDPLVPGGM